MYQDMALGSLMWIDHGDDGDTYTRVKLIQERQPSAIEVCRVCHRGQLSVFGHLIQHNILDDIICAVTRCDHCCALTVFKYHLEAGTFSFGEARACTDVD